MAGLCTVPKVPLTILNRGPAGVAVAGIVLLSSVNLNVILLPPFASPVVDEPDSSMFKAFLFNLSLYKFLFPFNI